MGRTVLGLLRAAHPEPVAAVTLAAGLLAVAVGHRPAGIAIVAAAVGASQLAVGWHNDWLDTDRDAAAGRTDKPVVTGAVGRRTVGVAAAAAALATVPLALLAGVPAALACALGLGSGLLYNWPLKRTALSVAPYAVSFAILPSFVVLALPGAPAPPPWLVLAGGLLGAGAHFANVLADLNDDVRSGIHGLPHRIGPGRSQAAAVILLLAATVTLTFGPPGPPSGAAVVGVGFAAVVLLLAWYATTRAADRGARSIAMFRAVMAVALVDVVLLVISGRLA